MAAKLQRQHELDARIVTPPQPLRSQSEPDLRPSLSHSQPMTTFPTFNAEAASHIGSSCSSCERSPLLERRSHYRRHCRSRHRPLSHSSARAFKAAMLNEELAKDQQTKELTALYDEGLGDASSLDSASVFEDESPERTISDVRHLRDSGCSSHSPDKFEPSHLRRCQSSP